MQSTETKLFLFFITIAVVALISNIIIDYLTPSDTEIDITEIIDYIVIFSILGSIIFGIKKK